VFVTPLGVAVQVEGYGPLMRLIRRSLFAEYSLKYLNHHVSVPMFGDEAM
jgi:hypothetical protein